MPKLSTLQAANAQRVMLFGSPKTGKTLLAGQLAEHFNLIYIDIENGKDTLFSLPQKWQERIELISIPDSRDLPIAAESLPKIQKGPVDICILHGKVSCHLCTREKAPTTHLDILHAPLDTIVVFDSGTQLGNSIQANIVKGEKEDFKPGWDEYNAQGYALDAFYSRIQIAPYHCIVISHVVEGINKGKKKQLVPQTGTANFSGNVAKYFNHVVYAEIKNRSHRFASSSTYSNLVVTGSRVGSALEDAEIPTLLSIFKPDAVPKSTPKVVQKKSSNNAALELLAKMKAKTTTKNGR